MSAGQAALTRGGRARELALLAVVVLLAGLLRMGRPDLTEFKRDEAALYGLALNVAELRAFPLRGIGSSVGLPNTAMSVYLFALPLFLWKSPLAATLFVGALNTASVGLAFLLARRYWGGRAALIAALLYAAAPWAVIYSRKIWAQNLLPLFVVGYIFTALLAFGEGRWRWLPVHLALLAVVAQIHYSGPILALITLVLLLMFRRAVDWRWAGWGVLAAGLLALPFGLYIVVEARQVAPQLMETRQVASLLLDFLARPATVSVDSVWLATLVSLGLEVHSLAGPEAFRDFLATAPDFTPLFWLGGGLALAGAGLATWRLRPGAARSSQARAGLVLLLWLAVPVLFFLRHSTPVFPHYFILLFPAPYVLAGIALDAALARWPARPLALLGWALPVSLAAAGAWVSMALLGFVGARATPGGFGVPLGRLLEVAGRVRAAPDVLVLSEGADPGVDETPAVFDVLLRGTPHRFVDARTTAVLPAAPARVIVWPGAGLYPGAALYPAAEFVALRAGEGEVRIADWSGVQPAVPRPRAAPALLANGAEVLGTGGGPEAWELWWRAPAGRPGEGYTLFAHLLDSDGARIAQADLTTYPVAGWRAGDLVVSYFTLGAGGVQVRAGMYGAQSLTPVDVLDAAGAPAGQWLESPFP